MLKVFLVEDEYVVREGIKRNVDWQAHGYEFCGEAGDGELAFPMIQKLRPDIVITDIRMPFMDGLALSRLIKKELPQTEIIILTGFEEFEYAKEALRIGVAEYLSKPINGEELIKEMDTVSKKILGKREIENKYAREMKEFVRQERKDFFVSLVTGDKSTEELLGMSANLNIDMSAMWHNVVLLILQANNHSYEEYSGSQVKMEERLKDLDAAFHVETFDRNLEGRAILFHGDDETELRRKQEEYLELVQEMAKEYPHIRYFVGIGKPVARLREISLSFEKACHAFAHRYLIPGNAILDSSDLSWSATPAQEDVGIISVSPKQMDRGKIQDFLKVGTVGEITYFVDEYFRALGGSALQSNLFRQYIVMDVYFCVVEFMENMQYDKSGIVAPDLAGGDFENKESVMSYAVAVLKSAIEYREQAVSDRYQDVAMEVIRYIEKNYADENLSLNTLASHVNFSPNHLSMIFSQKTGQNFIKYLTDYRMGKARELLRCTGKRSSEISVEVGYKDPHYFSYLFKKIHGMTPTEYRGK